MKAFCTTLLLVAATAASLHGEANLPFHFEHDLAPYLARAGCAAAECHGGATGRGGFKLSLFATNGRADYEAITQELGGRRVDFSDPPRSLVLRKPTRQMKHKGGEVITEESETYRALVAWIADGAPFARGETRSLTALALDLDRAGEQVAVTATFEGAQGARHSRDVTQLSRFASTDERVTSVDKEGRLTFHGPGEAWILARYGSQSARLAIRRPFGPRGDPPDTPHGLDDAWYERLAELGLPSGPAAAPHQLLRRLYLDLAGRPPVPDEIDSFFRLPATSQIETTVARLLDSDDFTNRLADHLAEWFEIPSPREDKPYTSDRNARLRSATRRFAASDASLLDFAASMIEKPASREFVNRFGDPRDRAEFAGRALLGIGIGCARCHNHPMDRWTQAQHLQFSAFFTDRRPSAGRGAAMAPGKFFLPGDGQPVKPILLPISRPPSSGPADGDHSEQLVRFLRTDAADALARNAANRIFGILMGRHLVESPDDHRLSNPAVHEPLLDLLITRFQESGYRLRPLVRLIATSNLYASASDPPGREALGEDPQLRYFARREARPMSGDEFLHAATSVLGVKHDALITPETPLAQQLHLLNSGLLQRWLRTPGNQVDAIFEFETDPARQLEQLSLLILSRPPRPPERAEFLPLLRDSDDPLAAGRDLAIAFLASREFSSIR